MKFLQKWVGATIADGKYSEYFHANVPGNIQKDYAEFMQWGDVNWMDNCTKYRDIEDWFWSYKSELVFDAKDNDRIFFVTEGIEYEYDIKLNNKLLVHHIGMFTKVEVDITDELKKGNELEIIIYPHPKREGAADCRDQADQSCKPAVCYGWDWHPRLLVSGIWNNTYIETRGENHLRDAEVKYKLNRDLTKADIHFEIDCDGDVEITLCDMDGNTIYNGSDTDIHLDEINLWWCRGQGEPYLYNWSVKSAENEIKGRLGLKKVRLVMNGDAWKVPVFPKSRAYAPITIELNGRNIFAKGSNWVNPEIFTGTIDENRYRTLIELAKEANMNILRCWGGANVDKEEFFDICDELGIMIWQEFPLACNNYVGTKEYLSVLEPEAKAIVKRVRRHACHVLWCGGNELFNEWSGMTEQSHALRLLDKICYEEDYSKPFIMTAPLYGMGHGHYQFYDFDTNRTVFEIYRNANNTAYSEFGTPSMSSMDQLREIFDEETLKNPSFEEDTPWPLHHGFHAWQKYSWCNFNIVEEIFGNQNSLEEHIEKSDILQCESYKCIFQEARRQKPNCSMALNWDFNEPWKTVAGNNIIMYPDKKKPSFYAVQESLRDVMPSARAEHFVFEPGDIFKAELWLLNDSQECIEDTVEVYFTIENTKRHIMTWNTGKGEANTNIRGHVISVDIPDVPTQIITLTLEAKCGTSEYRFLLKNDAPNEDIFIPKLNY